MKHLTLSSVAALSLLAGATAQSAPNFQFMPIPNFIVTSPTTGVGATFESVQLLKLGNEADGISSIILTVGALDAAFGGDGVSDGVLLGHLDPYSGTWTQTTEAAALNTAGGDQHLALSADGLHAILERAGTLHVSTRGSIGTPFPATTPVIGSPAPGLPSGELHPYLGSVAGVMQVFYADGTDLVMDAITGLGGATPTMAGAPVIVASEVQVSALPGSPSPLTGPDGDVEALWACDIVLPQAGPGTGDADPTYHADLDPLTPGIVRVQRTDWQGWGGIAGGFMMFSHDILGFHMMHGQVAHLLGDVVSPGGTADIRMAAPNFASPSPLTGIMLFGFGLISPLAVQGWYGGLGISPTSPVQIFGSTTTKDGIIDSSFAIPLGSPTGFKIPIQALMIEDDGVTRPTIGWSNTAFLEIL